jgi:UDP-GlcNAc:undecaprenyl-phosphate/decaprenyl-phosphate GlcNAc-1-phosphate transferase
MIFINNIYLMIFSFIASLTSCFILIQLSKHTGWLEEIKHDRWHKRKVAKFGGAAIYIATIIPIIISSNINSFTLFLITLGSVAFLIGLYDDVFGLFPSFKMLLFICFSILCFSYNIKLFNYYPIYFSLPLTILWITGIINAINIIDNMDGLSSGVSSIILASFAFMAYGQNDEITFLISVSLLGACLGFLVFNFSPAKIFMGDSGSLFIGIVLAILSLKISGNETNIFSILLVPTLLLVFPIFDTTLVTINRFLNRTPISRGGIDHTSHRLAGLGLSEKKVVLLLYFISACFCLIVIYFSRGGLRTWSLIFIITFCALGIVGLFLSYYANNEPELLHSAKDSHYIFKTMVQYKKQILEVLFDAMIIIFSFSFAHYLRYENNIPSDIWITHDKVIGLVLVLKFVTFYYFNLYKGIWKYASIPDIINVFKASFIASVLSIVMIVFVFGEYSFSRSIFFIDFVLTFLLISCFRVFYRVFLELIPISKSNRKGQKVLIIGAGQICQLILRKIFNNESNESFLPIGILDDKKSLTGRTLYGIPVLGSTEDFQEIVIKKNISMVLITISDSNIIQEFCIQNEIEFRLVSINI